MLLGYLDHLKWCLHFLPAVKTFALQSNFTGAVGTCLGISEFLVQVRNPFKFLTSCTQGSCEWSHV